MILVLVWLPLTVSAVLVGANWIAYWAVGGGSPRALVLLTLWFLVAAWLQLFAASPALTTTGLVLQAVLAVCLIVRARIQRGSA